MVDKIKFFVFRLTIDPQLHLSSNFSMSIVPYYQLFVIMGNFKILLKASIWTTLVVGVLENPDETLTFSFECSGIRNPKSGILGFGSYKRLESWIQVPLTKKPESSTWNPESTECNPESWALESIHLKESGSYKRFGIPNPSSTDKEPRIQYLESGIHGMESRIQDCLGFRYMRG